MRRALLTCALTCAAVGASLGAPVDSVPFGAEGFVSAAAELGQDSSRELVAAGGAVTADEIQREAAGVLEYCRRQTAYAAHNDCACIREQFIEERKKNPAKGVDPVQVATRIPVTACPNPDGVRAFYYDQCGSTYANKIKTGLEAFCSCYADEMRNQYVKQPRGSFSGMSRYGGGAMSICDQRGLPSPLHPDREVAGAPVADPSLQPDDRGFIPLPEGFCRPKSRSSAHVAAYRSCQQAKDPDKYARGGLRVNVDYHRCVYSGITLAGDQPNDWPITQDCEKKYGAAMISDGQ